MCNTWTASLDLIAGNLPEHTPAAYFGTFHAFLLTRHPDPPLNQITQQGCWSTGLELRILKLYISWKSPSKILETPSKFLRTAQKTKWPHPPPPSQNRLIYISIDRSRRQDSEYIIYIRIDACRRKDEPRRFLLQATFFCIESTLKNIPFLELASLSPWTTPPNLSHLALHPTQSPLNLIWMQDTWCYIETIEFAGNLAYWGVLWGPVRILHPPWQGKVAFLKLPRSTSVSGNKHYKCYITMQQCRILGRGTGNAGKWEALTQGTQGKKTKICRSIRCEF